MSAADPTPAAPPAEAAPVPDAPPADADALFARAAAAYEVRRGERRLAFRLSFTRDAMRGSRCSRWHRRAGRQAQARDPGRGMQGPMQPF